ncbi:unnamed protein product, partial [Symbiodinium sp. KB8]
MFIVEFSFWEEFGTYIWYVIVALKFVFIGVDMVLASQLKEALLLCPLASAAALVQGLITFGSEDFAAFLLTYAIEFGLAIAERVYVGPAMNAMIEFAVNFLAKAYAWVKSKIKIRRSLSLEQQLEKEEAAEEEGKQREVDIAVEGGDTVEPILDNFSGYACDTIALFFQPVLIVLMMLFRNEVEIPNLYGIREQDMEYYLWFSIIILFFQMCCDIFVHNVLELFHGWKMYDYLVYTRYRFLQRETRWKGMEDSLDECIEEGMRTLDQMCFSSQFYMMCTIHVTGIMFAIFGLEIILRARYNIFGDPALLILGPMIIIECYVLQRILVFVADKLGVWQIKHANTAWHATIGDDEDDDFGIPKWDELEKLKGASHQ